MVLKKLLEKFTMSAQDEDRARLLAALADLDVVSMDNLSLRIPQSVAGEIESVRVVPRASADAVEATLTDGRGRVTAVFLGRRRIPGISPGRRVVIEGVPSQSGRRTLVYNPKYRLLS
ncbi:MAG: OB-fold nucleic acid binding domain-containing protein [Acidimicrobiia bacterium]